MWSWTIKKAECQRTDTLELWCWRRLLRGLWTARRLNQSIRKEINPEYSLEGLMLKLKLQYFGYLMWRDESLEKTLNIMIGWHHWLNGHEFEQTQGDSDGQRSLACCSPCRIEHDLATEQWQQAEAFMQAAWTEQWGRRFEVSPGQDRSLNCVSARYRQWS